MSASLIAAREDCTGIAASWCPNHGDCTCPRDDDGCIEWHYEAGTISFHGFPAYTETAERVAHYDRSCPLHGEATDHA